MKKKKEKEEGKNKTKRKKLIGKRKKGRWKERKKKTRVHSPGLFEHWNRETSSNFLKTKTDSKGTSK